MSLPKIDIQLFELNLPLSKKKVTLRPFLMKEEKILLTAKESADSDQLILAVKQVLNNCDVKSELKLEELPMLELEYIFLNLRSRSIDNVVAFSIKDPDTEEIVPLKLDLNKMTISIPEKHTNIVRISDKYSVIMRYPSIDEFYALVKPKGSEAETQYDLMLNCMDVLVSEDERYNFSDYSKEEKIAFLDELDGQAVLNLKDFFSNMPKLRHEFTYTNKNNTEKTFVVEGLESFFI